MVRAGSVVLLLLVLWACGGSNGAVKKEEVSVTMAGGPRQGPPKLEGAAETITCSLIGGWAWDMNAPIGAVSVDIYVDGTKVETKPINIFRPDLLQAGKGDGNHAMHLLPPKQIADQKQHVVDVKFAGTDISLSGAPRTVQGCTGPPKEIFLDAGNCEAFVGWAYDPNEPDSRVKISLLENGKELATGVADVMREDLRKVGKSDGKHGFSILTPASLKDGRQHRVSAVIAGTRIEGGFSPANVTCQP